MMPVSLLASITDTKQVVGRIAAMTSSTSTRAVTLEMGTNVTSTTRIQSSQSQVQLQHNDFSLS